MSERTAARTSKSQTMGVEPRVAKTPPAVAKWCALLSEAGYRPKAEEVGETPQLWRVLFLLEGTKYTVYLDEQDPTYVQMELAYTLEPGLVPFHSLLQLANELNVATKAVKVAVSPQADAALFMVEWFSEALPAPEVLARLLSQSNLTASEFFRRRDDLTTVAARA